MFVGHYGVSFAAKRVAPTIPLWVLFLAVQLLDIYVVAFITVYYRVKDHRGTFVYDLGLDVLAIPYILIVGRLLLAGAALEQAVRKAVRKRRSRAADLNP
jgi:hypothetical protein